MKTAFNWGSLCIILLRYLYIYKELVKSVVFVHIIMWKTKEEEEDEDDDDLHYA